MNHKKLNGTYKMKIKTLKECKKMSLKQLQRYYDKLLGWDFKYTHELYNMLEEKECEEEGD
jgi:hypothetical protein